MNNIFIVVIVLLSIFTLAMFIVLGWNILETALKNRYNKKLRELREIEKNMFYVLCDLRLLTHIGVIPLKLIKSIQIDCKYEKLERK